MASAPTVRRLVTLTLHRRGLLHQDPKQVTWTYDGPDAPTSRVMSEALAAVGDGWLCSQADGHFYDWVVKGISVDPPEPAAPC